MKLKNIGKDVISLIMNGKRCSIAPGETVDMAEDSYKKIKGLFALAAVEAEPVEEAPVVEPKKETKVKKDGKGRKSNKK